MASDTRGRRDYRKHRARHLWWNAVKRARKAGVPCTITRKFVEKKLAAGVCEMTGLAFDLASSKQAYNSPSLDRKKPHLGYTPRNVRVICFGLNTAFNTWGQEKFVELVSAWFRELSRKSA